MFVKSGTEYPWQERDQQRREREQQQKENDLEIEVIINDVIETVPSYTVDGALPQIHLNHRALAKLEARSSRVC